MRRKREAVAEEDERRWSEEDSREFLAHGRFFVPGRDEQLRVLSDLLPVPPRGPFRVVDLCCGEGLLSRVVLDRHARARVSAVDASPAMLAAATATNAAHADRFEATPGTLEDYAPDPANPPIAVVSSLAVHHLDAGGKRALFRRVADGLGPAGCLLIADLVEPAVARARRLAARMWDEEVAQRAAEARAEGAVEIFRRQGWNHFDLALPDPVDTPSPLFDQLGWLVEAGFRRVDVFWMRAGHAVYGGFKEPR